MEKSAIKNSYIEARLLLPEDISDEIKQEIIDVLKVAKFTKLSYPIAALNFTLSDNGLDENADITKTTIVGYIKKFIKDKDKDDAKFIINIYNPLRKYIEAYSDPVVIVNYREYDGKLSVITKLVIKDDNAKYALSNTEETAG